MFGSAFAGDPPFVVARGGFSGLFPDSSGFAYSFAVMVSVPDVILWCDVQLTKDGVGICLPDLSFNNATDAKGILGENRSSVYLVNGVATKGLFTVDFNAEELANVSRKFILSTPLFSLSFISSLSLSLSPYIHLYQLSCSSCLMKSSGKFVRVKYGHCCYDLFCKIWLSV